MPTVVKTKKITKILKTTTLTFLTYKLSRRAIGGTYAERGNCIPPAEVALNLAFGNIEKNGDIYRWALGRGEGVERGERERVTFLNTIG